MLGSWCFKLNSSRLYLVQSPKFAISCIALAPSLVVCSVVRCLVLLVALMSGHHVVKHHTTAFSPSIKCQFLQWLTRRLLLRLGRRYRWLHFVFAGRIKNIDAPAISTWNGFQWT
jgi:hypothetical protein